MRYKVGAEQFQQVPSLVHRPDTVFRVARTLRLAQPTPSTPLPGPQPVGSRSISYRFWTRTGKQPASSRSAQAASP